VYKMTLCVVLNSLRPVRKRQQQKTPAAAEDARRSSLRNVSR
jgi:hypothetical protein